MSFESVCCICSSEILPMDHSKRHMLSLAVILLWDKVIAYLNMLYILIYVFNRLSSEVSSVIIKNCFTA